ncbi:hypothetical protein HID58_083219 [Brassica napus]|uniref:Uncharacterized protein n=1 Tax=Brassica napus TaxID=3708 RepID=A0ABQ7YFE1_BRANA|nr:hypothetical protein HID58_083219 [Brassica napus]
MAHRRLSLAEKGKGMEIGPQQPLRAARVKAPAPDNSELIRKHHLTLIGREAAGKLYIEENQTLHKETSRPPTGEFRSSSSKAKEYRNETFARDSYSREHQNSYAAREDRRYGQNYPNNRENRATWRDRGSFVENSTRYHPYKRKENFDNASRQQVYREVRRIDPEARQNARGSESQGHSNYVRDNPRLREEVRREESSSSKTLVNPAERGIPLQREPLHLGKKAMEVALGEVRDTMLQYTKVADPTKSAARQERVRQAEEKGQLETDSTTQ